MDSQVDFRQCDYTKTPFEDETFDVVWACESVSSSLDKPAFLKEAIRVLKKGGRLVVCDIFWRKDMPDPNNYIKKLNDTWATIPLESVDLFGDQAKEAGFGAIKVDDWTNEI